MKVISMNKLDEITIRSIRLDEEHVMLGVSVGVRIELDELKNTGTRNNVGPRTYHSKFILI